MPIDIVVNGYFRSGTTFIWDFLKKELEGQNYISLYEPLHSNLSNLILQEKKNKKKNKLHNKILFEDYLKLNEETLYKLIKNNPNANNFGINSDIELKYYLDIIHNISIPIFLQPNRLHFHLDIIFENYTRNVIHTIRHPLDVWLSIVNAYGKDSSSETLPKKTLRFLLKPFRLKYSFEIEKNFKWIYYKIGYPLNLGESLSTRILNFFNAFEKFVVVWTVSNYYAIKSIKKNNGLLLVYESIICKPDMFINQIGNFLSIDIKGYPNIKKQNYFKFKDSDINKLRNTIDKYKLSEEFTYILNEVDKSFKWKI
jgi:hypothetical protein